MSVADEVRAEVARQRSNYTALAKAAGMRRATLSDRLNEHSEFTLPELKAIGKVLAVPRHELIRRADERDAMAA